MEQQHVNCTKALIFDTTAIPDGRDDDGGGGGVDMRGLLIPVESLTNPHHYLLTNKILNIYLLTKLTLSAIREKAKSPQIAQEIFISCISHHHQQFSKAN